MFVDERMVYEMKLTEILWGSTGTALMWPGTDSAWEWPYDKITLRHHG